MNITIFEGAEILTRKAIKAKYQGKTPYKPYEIILAYRYLDEEKITFDVIQGVSLEDALHYGLTTMRRKAYEGAMLLNHEGIIMAWQK